ncbi:MAG: lipocalin family protein [Bacteroidales bacterium]|nr:lipocalin family protein [Bacteroidales bacterium]
MNIFKPITAAILCIVLFSLLTQGCNKDENTEEPGNDMALVGRWKITEVSWKNHEETGTYSEHQLDSIGLVWTFNIKDDGTAEQTTNISGPLVTFQGTWDTSANQLTLNLTGPGGEDGKMIYEYAIHGNILKLDWSLPAGTKYHAEFTRQEPLL